MAKHTQGYAAGEIDAAIDIGFARAGQRRELARRGWDGWRLDALLRAFY